MSENALHFARALCAIRATQELKLDELGEALGLAPADLQALFYRAEVAWSTSVLGALEAQHDTLADAERDHHAIRHCQCDIAARWASIKDGGSQRPSLPTEPTAPICPACNDPNCNCVACDGSGSVLDEETHEPEKCLVCTGEYWGGRAGNRLRKRGPACQ